MQVFIWIRENWFRRDPHLILVNVTSVHARPAPNGLLHVRVRFGDAPGALSQDFDGFVDRIEVILPQAPPMPTYSEAADDANTT